MSLFSAQCRCRFRRLALPVSLSRSHFLPSPHGLPRRNHPHALGLSLSRWVPLSRAPALSLSRSSHAPRAPASPPTLQPLALSPVSLSRLSDSRWGLVSRSGHFSSRVFGSRQQYFFCPVRTVPISEYPKLVWTSCLCFGWKFENFEPCFGIFNRCSIIVSP